MAGGLQEASLRELGRDVTGLSFAKAEQGRHAASLDLAHQQGLPQENEGSAIEPPCSHLVRDPGFDAAKKRPRRQQPLHELDLIDGSSQEIGTEIHECRLAKVTAAVEVTAARLVRGEQKALVVGDGTGEPAGDGPEARAHL